MRLARMERIERTAGGTARLRVIATLGAVLALDSADKGMVGATTTNLERAFSVGTTRIGLLLTVTSVVSVVATVPFGMLVDRVRRVHLLAVVVVGWGLVMLVGAAATTYTMLLVSRVLLGAAASVAYPAVASLVGDWFPSAERGRVLGLLLAGELVGTGVGLLVAGGAAIVVSWRLAFALVGAGALGVGWLLRGLPEPARGGASRMPAGQVQVPGLGAGGATAVVTPGPAADAPAEGG